MDLRLTLAARPHDRAIPLTKSVPQRLFRFSFPVAQDGSFKMIFSGLGYYL
jgi:hypothetical protein